MDVLSQDIRIGIRRLLHSKMFALMAIGTLAIGLGANTAVFTLINAIRLRPLPFVQPSPLVDLYEHHPVEVCDGCGVGTSYLNYVDWKRSARSFSAMAAYDESSASIRLNENAQKKYVARVSADLFPLLGVAPLRGRHFTREEENAGGATVSLISEQLASRAFGDAAAAVGRSLRVNGELFTIVGVMPERFVFPEHADVWLPYKQAPNAVRNDRSIGVVARIAEGVSAEQAAAEMTTISRALAQRFPAEQKGWSAHVMSLHGDLASDYMQQGTLLLAAVSCVLLIVCANLTNLMIARTANRRPELAVRAAMGASRWQLARQMLVESMLVSAAGAIGGMLIALWGVELIRVLAADALPRWIQYDMDWRVFVYALLLATITGLLFGLLPARFAAKASVADVLKESGRGVQGSRSPIRVRDVLVVAQVAIAFVLVAAAGLLIKGAIKSGSLDMGYNTAGLIRADIGADAARYESGANVAEFSAQVLRDIQLGSGVSSAAISAYHFINWPGTPPQQIVIDGVSAERAASAFNRMQGVSPAFFETLGLRRVSGRTFGIGDSFSAPRVAIVNPTLASRLWGEQPAVGRHIRIGNDDWMIVGVVSELRESPLGNGAAPMIYVPLEQLTARQPSGQALTLQIRTVPGATSIPALVNAAVAKADADVTVENVMSVEDFHRQWRKPMQTVAITAAVLGAFASLLAAIGIYGVLSYLVSQRTQEIGIRMALGASVKDVVRLVMSYGVKLALAGTVVGIAGAGAFTQLLGYMLFGVSPLDPTVYALVATLFLAVALLAVYVPSRQASRVNPLDALRAE